MRTVTHVEFRGRRAERADPRGLSATRHPRESGDAWVDRVAAWWYSPLGRLLVCAVTLAVILTGLGILVFALWLIGRGA